MTQPARQRRNDLNKLPEVQIKRVKLSDPARLEQVRDRSEVDREGGPKSASPASASPAFEPVWEIRTAESSTIIPGPSQSPPEQTQEFPPQFHAAGVSSADERARGEAETAAADLLAEQRPWSDHHSGT